MKFSLAYGRGGLEIELPNSLNADVIRPKYVPALKNEISQIRRALKNPVDSEPLKQLVKPSDKVGIVFNDITRATPYKVIMPALLAELSDIPKENIVLFNATGTHRTNTDAELRAILGNDCVDNYRIVQNDAADAGSHLCVGKTSSGNEIKVLTEYVECDIRILTGFIEPHFFAGFSGGPKACVPGLADLKTVLRNHCAKQIDQPNSTWGHTEDNPLWQELLEATELAGPAFLLNVALNTDKKVTAVFVGDLRKAHRQGCRFVKENAMAPVNKLYDIVITSNSGHPLDLNMYQSVKGLSAAARIVKPDGIIIIAANCWDGIPEHGMYGKLLAESKSPQELLAKIRAKNFLCRDSWEAQIHAMICEKAKIYFYSDNLSGKQIRDAFMQPCNDITETVKSIINSEGGRVRVCILPDGPLTIPYLQSFPNVRPNPESSTTRCIK